MDSEGWSLQRPVESPKEFPRDPLDSQNLAFHRSPFIRVSTASSTGIATTKSTSSRRDVGGKFPAFASEQAKEIFWNRFTFYTQDAQFTPWVTSIVVNHYHVLGYCKSGDKFGMMMQRIHGSVAKLVNDLLPERRTPFWGDPGQQDYFDGCIRDEKQCRRAYRYTLTQSVRHGLCRDWQEYRHTRVNVDLEAGVRRALELHAFLEGVRYKRYQKRLE